MARKRHIPEQIIAKLREADVRLAAGEKTKAICRSLGIAEQTQRSMAPRVWRPEGRSGTATEDAGERESSAT